MKFNLDDKVVNSKGTSFIVKGLRFDPFIKQDEALVQDEFGLYFWVPERELEKAPVPPTKDEVEVLTPMHVDLFCPHEWVTYYGLTETFDYCKKCDIKRGL